MPKKALGSSFDFGGDLGAGDAQPLLQILLVADEHVDVLDDLRRATATARSAPPDDAPELLADS